MKTRRSNKSFEMPPPRRSRKSGKRRRALNIVNETIVISDSEPEDDDVQIANDDDILVIDIADASDVPVNEANVEDQGSVGIPDVALKPESEVSNSERETLKLERDERDVPMPEETEVVSPEKEKSETPVVDAPAVINIEDEPDQNDDEDGVEVLAVVVSSGSRFSRTRQNRSSLKRKSSNGSLSQMQESIKKAKTTVRRSSSSISTSTRAALVPIYQPLNRVATNSKKIKRANKRRKNKFPMREGNFQDRGGNFQGRGGNFQGRGRYFQGRGDNFQSRGRNGLFHNRTRECERQVIFRPENDQQQSVQCTFAPNDFSFERNPFIPNNTSTPAFSRNEERATWMPSRRQGPAPIAPGSNIMNAGQDVQREKGSLRPIVIDGSNIAVGHGGMIHGPGNKFSARGIQICVEYFKKRGHKEIVVFVPRFRLKKAECRDPELLEEMEKQGYVRFTPSREAGGQRIASYDDLFVVEYAHETGGIIISNDNFKDLYARKPHLQESIKFRLLQYTWITPAVIMFPEDPLGRSGPSLDEFLRF